MADISLDEYHAMTRRAGWALFERSQVEVTGKDRARLLHGLCTNDVKRLQPGEGCEAFLTDAQGHTIGYVYIFCQADGLIIDSEPGEAAAIIRSLDRYVVREDVRFADRSEVWGEILVCGPDAVQLVRAALGVEIPPAWGANGEVTCQQTRVSVRRTSYCGPDSLHLSIERPAVAGLVATLERQGIRHCSEDVVETIRVEQGTPRFGRDVTAENLPQEVDRDERTISFTKGCYLGQETVARIDSLGHVNRLLRHLRFSGSEVPPVGGDLVREGKAIARITSACRSPRFQAPLALAYVRRGSHQFGTRLVSPWGEAEVLRATQ